MSEDEVPLTGGRVTAGIVRVGSTVRRPMRSGGAAVQTLLRQLETAGFDGTPRFLGIDEQNREILSFLPGEVPSDLGRFEDVQLATAARLLRRFHDATAEMAKAADPEAEVICHNDWGPPNAVFRGGLPYGIIDFDTIAPGLRLWDLGYSAFSWLHLGDTDYSGDEQIRRLSVFADGYGLDRCRPAHIAAYALARQTMLVAAGRRRGMTNMADWAADAAAWTAENVVERLLPTRMWSAP